MTKARDSSPCSVRSAFDVAFAKLLWPLVSCVVCLYCRLAQEYTALFMPGALVSVCIRQFVSLLVCPLITREQYGRLPPNF